MRNDLLLEPWRIRAFSSDLHDDFLESVFFLGNGRMGARGYPPFDRGGYPIQTGLYVAGIFGEIRPGITDIVNLPTPVFERIYLDGSEAEITDPVEYTLDLRNALLTVRARAAAGGKSAELVCHRFFPKEHTGLCMQRTEVKAEQAAHIRLQSGIYLSSCNCPVPDDQTKDNAEEIKLARLVRTAASPKGFACGFRISGTDLAVEERLSFRSTGDAGAVDRDDDCAFMSFDRRCEAGESLILDKLSFITTSRDIDSRISAPPAKWNYDMLLSGHRNAWALTWQRCDLPVFRDDSEQQCALRYAMFQLMGSCSAKDPTVSIGARGLTHGRYKGCYFWDADFFMLPFFLANDTEAAKNLCEYRVRSLDAAREHSRKMNTLGARYPWMASLDGSEQCETWDIGCSELHVTADVVYALDRYCTEAGDEMFYLDRAAAVYVETARFWVSRYTWHPESGTADLLFCKGPDEYCGVSSNNLFTNVMVQYNLSLACRAAEELMVKRPELYRSLKISEEEVSAWRHLRGSIRWPRDPKTGHLTTDDTFHLLEPVEPAAIKPNDEASYHTVCFDRLQRYKVVKQADVLLLMTRLPELFTQEEKLQAWRDFEPICLHDSTLSFASHALFAAQNGLKEEAARYLRKALLLDLRDIMGNTGKEGLHLAGMGEAWQAARTELQARESH